jgi:phage-related protein
LHFPSAYKKQPEANYDAFSTDKSRLWKPMKSIGAGVNEIRVRDTTGAFRVIYIAKLKDAIYVLHCFEKKSQRTSLPDLRVATARYKDLVAGRGDDRRTAD